MADPTEYPLLQRCAETNLRDVGLTADDHNEPGQFTAFIGYEDGDDQWQQSTSGGGLPRRGGQGIPYGTFTSQESPDPRELWKRCAVEDETARVMAIAHNLSNGMMFKHNGGRRENHSVPPKPECGGDEDLGGKGTVKLTLR